MTTYARFVSMSIGMKLRNELPIGNPDAQIATLRTSFYQQSVERITSRSISTTTHNEVTTGIQSLLLILLCKLFQKREEHLFVLGASILLHGHLVFVAHLCITYPMSLGLVLPLPWQIRLIICFSFPLNTWMLFTSLCSRIEFVTCRSTTAAAASLLAQLVLFLLSRRQQVSDSCQMGHKKGLWRRNKWCPQTWLCCCSCGRNRYGPGHLHVFVVD